MDPKQIAEDMQELIRSGARTKAAQIRDVFDHVEAALNAGVSRAAVLDKLNERGLDMTMATFETSLRRIRRERAGLVTAQDPTPVPSSLPAAPSAPQAASTSSAPSPAAPPAAAASVDRSNPHVLTDILNSVPDLDQLSGLAKRNRKP